MDDDDLDEDDDSFDGYEMVLTSDRKNSNRKTNASPLTPTSMTFAQIYGMIAALSPLVDALDWGV